MKTLFAIGLTILLLSFSTGAMADPGKGKSEAWSPEKQSQVERNQCFDSGKGNGLEKDGNAPGFQCKKFPNGDEDANRDRDPGLKDPHAPADD